MTLFDELFDTLPNHLTNDKDFTDILRLFFDVIEERYELSQDLIQSKMIDVLFEKFLKTNNLRLYNRRAELLKFHLNELFLAVENAYKDETFYKRIKSDFEKLGLETPSDLNIEEKLLKSLNQQRVNSNKIFNKNKGKLISFIYAFQVISNASIQAFNASDGFIRIIENIHPTTGEPIPFSYRVESSLYKETFDTIIKPLTHPIGFGNAFATLLTFIFEDYFLVKETKTLESCVIRCLNPDGTYSETNVLENQYLGFNETLTDKGTEFWLKYSDKDSNEIKKLLVSSDNIIKIYSLDNLKIKSIRLKDPLQGFFNEIKDPSGNIQAIDYHQYFINRKKSLWLFFTLDNDLSNKEYTSIINYDPDQFSVVVGESYLKPMRISAADIINSVYGDFHGRLVETLSRTCGVHYNIKVERITQVKEELSFVDNKEFLDYVSRVPKAKQFSKTIYRIGNAYNSDKNPPEWIPLINEDDFYILSEDFFNNNFHLYPFETSANEIPKFEILGKNEEFWLKEYPRYDEIINSNEVSSSGVEAFNKNSLAWDVIISEQKILFKRDENTSFLIPKEWKIGNNFNIGEKYTDLEISDFINGIKPLPNGEKILTIGYFYDNSFADGDLYPTLEINDDNFSFNSEISTNLLDNVQKPTENDIISEINSTISEYFLIDSDFVKVSFESEFNLTKNDISLQTHPIFIGSFEIGNDFTDEEIEQAQKGEITLSNDLMFINYRLSEDLIIGDKFPTFEINETLDFQIIRRT